jgi:hypothetical protein
MEFSKADRILVPDYTEQQKRSGRPGLKKIIGFEARLFYHLEVFGFPNMAHLDMMAG